MPIGVRSQGMVYIPVPKSSTTARSVTSSSTTISTTTTASTSTTSTSSPTTIAANVQTSTVNATEIPVDSYEILADAGPMPFGESRVQAIEDTIQARLHQTARQPSIYQGENQRLVLDSIPVLKGKPLIFTDSNASQIQEPVPAVDTQDSQLEISDPFPDTEWDVVFNLTGEWQFLVLSTCLHYILHTASFFLSSSGMPSFDDLEVISSDVYFYLSLDELMDYGVYIQALIKNPYLKFPVVAVSPVPVYLAELDYLDMTDCSGDYETEFIEIKGKEKEETADEASSYTVEYGDYVSITYPKGRTSYTSASGFAKRLLGNMAAQSEVEVVAIFYLCLAFAFCTELILKVFFLWAVCFRNVLEYTFPSLKGLRNRAETKCVYCLNESSDNQGKGSTAGISTRIPTPSASRKNSTKTSAIVSSTSVSGW